MISYKEEYFRRLEQEPVFASSSFSALKKNAEKLTFYYPYNDQEEHRFLKEAKEILEIIAGIIRKPQIRLKYVDQLVMAHQAGEVDTESFTATVRDPSLWKRKGDKMAPEYVHHFTTDDTCVSYENIFVVRVLDFLKEELSALKAGYEMQAGNLRSFFGTKDFGYHPYSAFSALRENPALSATLLKTPLGREHSESVARLLKKCSSLASTSFYKELRQNKLLKKSVVPTNILLNDPRYFACYKFFRKYTSSRDDGYFLPLYQDYVLLRILHDLQDTYRFNETINRFKVAQTERGLTLSSALYLQDPYFLISLKKDPEACGFIVSVKLKKAYDAQNAHHPSGTYYIAVALRIDSENLDALQRRISEKLDEGYDDACIVALQNSAGVYENSLTVSFYTRDDVPDALKNLFASYHFLFEGEEDTYSAQCPVCGMRSVHAQSADYRCASCRSAWTALALKQKNYLWIKGFGGK